MCVTSKENVAEIFWLWLYAKKPHRNNLKWHNIIENQLSLYQFSTQCSFYMKGCNKVSVSILIGLHNDNRYARDSHNTGPAAPG